MTAAAKWLDQELGAQRRPEERVLLLVEEFDPHEAFDAHEKWANLNDDAWDTAAFIRCTDHVIYLGERGRWGRPVVAIYPELGHILGY